MDNPTAADAVGIADPGKQPGTLPLEQTVRVALPPVPYQGSKEQLGATDCARVEALSARQQARKVTMFFIILLHARTGLLLRNRGRSVYELPVLGSCSLLKIVQLS
jgi:hypothetical protein